MTKRKSLFIVLTALLMVILLSSAVLADSSTQEADDKLDVYVYNNGSESVYTQKSYKLSGGGSIDYQSVVNEDGTVNDNFTELTADDQANLLRDMSAAADKAVKEEDDVTEETKTTWLQQLQACDGVGSQLMAVLLENTKPDFVSANRIYQPFSGVVGIVLGLGSILIMSLLGITMVLDIAYIGLPMFRMALDGEGTGEAKKPKIISYEAVSAIATAEGSSGGAGGSGNSGGKIAIGIYFKKRVLMLIVLGVCLLYLVQGQIFTMVAWILDLLSGFTG